MSEPFPELRQNLRNVLMVIDDVPDKATRKTEVLNGLLGRLVANGCLG